ncbi:DUF3693 domain-containing protein [Xylella fastidiosa]|uniref:DUF3693 domain-containing protein n=1 Tax=Xylella fastidiosa TaxID=2371 RepID=UPI001197D9E2|nr:DUF3693 domain-containing protein [Xylella fastidiosa]MBS9446553.1 helix-turn-helix domain-containing protein [Xylella fastidiosa subsp. multiplex]MBS9450324.1 helix-turn-helix domain-containing protein [Xylella fastidiosa subsp. multiplex]MBS9486669.1 helix-turn-helix domain-containing protein [Xylella fastidiosa subsp. multiplex]MBS9522151.1 helix-turn-helix domain-containing protein [Xylella fastidiosa subsp. multiplex]MCP8325862.1 DUF3693 domain-containing protein [Xylella fastidiosa su
MEINLLLDKAKEACVVKYDKDLAQKLKIRATSISNYRKGISLPDATVCAELANITGLPLAKVLGIVGEARAISREEKAVWRKLATLAATTLLIGAGITYPPPSQAQSICESSVMKIQIMHIMSAGKDGYEN